MGLTQKEGVFQAYSSLKDAHTGKELTEQTRCAVAAMLQSGEINWDSPDKGDAACLKYASSLVSNWFKRDPRITGAQYTPVKLTGPRVKDLALISIDNCIRSLKVNEPSNTAVLMALQTKRAERVAAIKASKAATKVMSSDELNAALVSLGIATVPTETVTPTDTTTTPSE